MRGTATPSEKPEAFAAPLGDGFDDTCGLRRPEPQAALRAAGQSRKGTTTRRDRTNVSSADSETAACLIGCTSRLTVASLARDFQIVAGRQVEPEIRSGSGEAAEPMGRIESGSRPGGRWFKSAGLTIYVPFLRELSA